MINGGNKGEWSEIYVFLKLLADGKLYAANAELKAIPNIYYPLIKILRKEVSSNRHYCIFKGNIEVIDGETDDLLLTIPTQEFVQKSHELFEFLKESSGRTFRLDVIKEFLESIEVNSLTALSSDKSDIRIVVHDLTTGMTPTLGFSIKSMLGKDSTLFNPGAGTNFIFKLTNTPLGFDHNLFNATTLQKSKLKGGDAKISVRIKELENLGFKIEFDRIQSENLKLNLELIDSQLPQILAQIVYYKYKTGTSRLTDLLSFIKTYNPLNFNLSKGHPFYEVKIKSFLTESALGMTPETVWTGVYDATGGIIIVKKSGELVCYHIYNKNEFQDYLVNNTRLEQAATSEDDLNPGYAVVTKAKPYKFGWVYEENGELYLKLNLQIRFK